MIFTQQLGMSGRGKAQVPVVPTANLWNAYGLHLLIQSYTGAAIRVRRSSDSTEQDINFNGLYLDVAALLSFAGAGDAYIVKLYDQTGNGRYMGQTTTGMQPRIVASGVYDGFVRFDGSDDFLTSNGNSSGSNSGVTFYMRGALRSTASLQVLLELSSNFNSFKAPLIVHDTTFQLITHNGSGGIYCIRDHASGLIPTERVSAFRFDTTQAANDENRWFAAGAEVAGTPTHFGGGDTSGNFAAQAWNLGKRNGGTSAAALNFVYGALYETAHADDLIKSISETMQ